MDITSSSTSIAFTMQVTDPLSIQMVNFRFSAIVDVTRNATAHSSHLNCGSRLWNLSLKMTFKRNFVLDLHLTFQFIKTRPGCKFIVLQTCSVIAHLKLGICFMAKLCGCGAGEEPCCDGSCAKNFASLIGFIGSAVSLGLTVMSFVEAVRV